MDRTVLYSSGVVRDDFSTLDISPLMAGSNVQNQVPGCPLRPVSTLTQPRPVNRPVRRGFLGFM